MKTTPAMRLVPGRSLPTSTRRHKIACCHPARVNTLIDVRPAESVRPAENADQAESARQDPPPGRAETECVCTALRMATRSIARLYDRALSQAGLRVTGYSILSRLGAEGPLSVSELAARLAMERTTCTREVAPLVRSGLVEATAGSDRRRRLLRLTDLGRRRLAEGRPAWENVQRLVAGEFGEADLRDLLGRLDRLLESSERLREGVSNDDA
jgi:DNA-binding MarR family transcriptional regulator